jgi:hypothetical protein
MRITYLTIDEVNAALALRLARSAGIDLHVLAPKDAVSPGPWHVFLCDLDALSPAEPLLALAKWISALQPELAAVHSYKLSDCQRAGLRKDGVRVFRRLGRRVFRRLQQTVARNGERVLRANKQQPAVDQAIS